MSDYFHENAVRKKLEPKERNIPCKECFIFKIEEERVKQFIANYKASTLLQKMIPLSVIEDIKAEIEAKKEKEVVCIEEDLINGAFDDALDIIDRKIAEVKGDKE